MRLVLKMALAGVAVALVLVAAGCGSGGDPPPPGTASAAEFLLTQADLDRQPQGSPEAALLGWWRSIQYNDFEGYADSLAAPLRQRRRTGESGQRDLALAAGELVRAQPKVAETQISGDRATVYTRIESRQPVGASRFTTSSTPQAFTLVREGDQWKIADDFFVTNRADDIRKVIDASRSSAGG